MSLAGYLTEMHFVPENTSSALLRNIFEFLLDYTAISLFVLYLTRRKELLASLKPVGFHGLSQDYFLAYFYFCPLGSENVGAPSNGRLTEVFRKGL
jgi:hypothetical protein